MEHMPLLLSSKMKNFNFIIKNENFIYRYISHSNKSSRLIVDDKNHYLRVHLYIVFFFFVFSKNEKLYIKIKKKNSVSFIMCNSLEIIIQFNLFFFFSIEKEVLPFYDISNQTQTLKPSGI